jgi:hypothetical protein
LGAFEQFRRDRTEGQLLAWPRADANHQKIMTAEL